MKFERLFRRLKAFRRIFSRFEKLDLMFAAFIHIALIMEMPQIVLTELRYRDAYLSFDLCIILAYLKYRGIDIFHT